MVFEWQEQQFLAALVRTHRRKIPKSAFDALPDRLLASARRSAALLRIAALLHRSREAGEIPDLEVAAGERGNDGAAERGTGEGGRDANGHEGRLSIS